MSYSYNYGLPPELAREYEEYAREQLLQQEQQRARAAESTTTTTTAGEAATYPRAPDEHQHRHHHEEQRAAPASTTTTKRKRSSKKADNVQEVERLQNELVESKRREQELMDDLTEKELELEGATKQYEHKSREVDDVTRQLQETKKELANTTKLLTDARQKLADTNARFSRVEQREATLHESLRLAQEEIKKLKQQRPAGAGQSQQPGPPGFPNFANNPQQLGRNFPPGPFPPMMPGMGFPGMAFMQPGNPFAQAFLQQMQQQQKQQQKQQQQGIKKDQESSDEESSSEEEEEEKKKPSTSAIKISQKNKKDVSRHANKEEAKKPAAKSTRSTVPKKRSSIASRELLALGVGGIKDAPRKSRVDFSPSNRTRSHDGSSKANKKASKKTVPKKVEPPPRKHAPPAKQPTAQNKKSAPKRAAKSAPQKAKTETASKKRAAATDKSPAKKQRTATPSGKDVKNGESYVVTTASGIKKTIEVSKPPPSEEVEGKWPRGWRKEVETYKTGDGMRSLQYWYSPGGVRLRSRLEVARFLAALEKTNGDEEKAKSKMHSIKLPTLKAPKSSSKTKKVDKPAPDLAQEPVEKDKDKKSATDKKPKAKESGQPAQTPPTKKAGGRRDRQRHLSEFTEKLESMCLLVEGRPDVGPFLKPVSRKLYPEYFEQIENPMDLASIRRKLQSFQYTTCSAFLRDFDLMKSNAVKFNGADHEVGKEGVDIYDAVKEEIIKDAVKLQQLEKSIKQAAQGAESEKVSDDEKSGAGEGDAPAPDSALEVGQSGHKEGEEEADGADNTGEDADVSATDKEKPEGGGEGVVPAEGTTAESGHADGEAEVEEKDVKEEDAVASTNENPEGGEEGADSLPETETERAKEEIGDADEEMQDSARVEGEERETEKTTNDTEQLAEEPSNLKESTRSDKAGEGKSGEVSDVAGEAVGLEAEASNKGDHEAGTTDGAVEGKNDSGDNEEADGASSSALV